MKSCAAILILFVLTELGRADVFTNVPAGEIAGYQLVYELAIPVISPGWNNAGTLAAAYSVNNSGSIANGSFTRIGYYMELMGSSNANLRNGWVFVSFDAAGITTQANMTGVPNTFSGEFYQKNVSNMNVFASANLSGVITTGTGIQTGNIEFWPSNYTEANTRAAGNGGPVPNAQGDLTGNTGFDFGDGGASTSSGHGSMQLHNYDIDGTGPGTAGQTLFAYSNWGNNTNRVADLGFGNNPVAGQAPDYTLTSNADDTGAWTTRTLQVVVLVPEPGSIALLGSGMGFLLRRRSRRYR